MRRIEKIKVITALQITKIYIYYFQGYVSKIQVFLGVFGGLGGASSDPSGVTVDLDAGPFGISRSAGRGSVDFRSGFGGGRASPDLGSVGEPC